MTQKAVRVRVAPSPTGDPHVGTAYITLFNYIFAKQNNGELILRIEDTDRSRYRRNSETEIFSSLAWLGLKWDEGPDCGGEYGPYRQSERLKIYQEHAQILINTGAAYRCNCSQERLAKLTEEQKQKGQNPGYDGHCRELNLTDPNAVVRLKVPNNIEVTFKDQLRGDITVHSSQITDQILLKSDGYPTYHLANVVDDHLMEISHVMRAEEWISSTVKHILLYQAFGWEPPQFIHLALLRNSDKSKISKRKNPVSIDYYRREGILPQAMTNFLALMGWSYSSDREIFTLKEMLDKFQLSTLHKGGPVFDPVKLLHINQHYIQNLTPDEFATHLRSEVFTEEYLKQIQPLLSSRLRSFSEFNDKADFLFKGLLNYPQDKLIPKGQNYDSVISVLKNLTEALETLDTWDEKPIEETIKKQKDLSSWKTKDFFMLIRLLATGRYDSPPLAPSLVVIGKAMLLQRFRAAEAQLREKKLADPNTAV